MIAAELFDVAAVEFVDFCHDASSLVSVRSIQLGANGSGHTRGFTARSVTTVYTSTMSTHVTPASRRSASDALK